MSLYKAVFLRKKEFLIATTKRFVENHWICIIMTKIICKIICKIFENEKQKKKENLIAVHIDLMLILSIVILRVVA